MGHHSSRLQSAISIHIVILIIDIRTAFATAISTNSIILHVVVSATSSQYPTPRTHLRYFHRCLNPSAVIKTYHYCGRCNFQMSSKSQPHHPPPNSNQLRHRFQLNTKAKVKDDDDDNDDDDRSSKHDIGKMTQNQNDSTAAHPTGNRRPRKNSHSNIEKSLIVKRTKQLQQENDQLKQTIQQLHNENRKLRQRLPPPPPLPKFGAVNVTKSKPPVAPPMVVLERFEGEKLLSNRGDDIEYGSGSHGRTDRTGNDTHEMWCDTPLTSTGDNDDGMCPVEPDIDFRDALRDRAVWLVSLLILQSISGIILYKNELVLSNHPSST